MTKKKIIDGAIDMTKNISATDGVLTPLDISEEGDLTPYPEVEYDVLFDSNLNKLIRNVNTRIWQWRQTEWGIQVVQSNLGTRFYQAMIRWNVDGGSKPEMPSKNSEAGAQGSQPLHIPGLEDEPDLYEDVEKDVDKAEGSAVEW